MAPRPWRRPATRETAVDPRAFMLTSSARSRLDLGRAGRAAADKAAAVPSYAAQTGGLRRATLTRRPHAGLPELGQARSGRMPVAQFASDGRRSRPSKTCPSSGTTVSELRQAGCSQVRLSRGSSPFAETHPRRLPPVTWDHGLRLWLKSAASGRLCRSCCFWWAKALGGETKISYRPFCPSSGGSLPQDQV